MKNGSFYQLNDEAIDAIKSQMTEQMQKATYKQIKENFGDFQSSKLRGNLDTKFKSRHENI